MTMTIGTIHGAAIGMPASADTIPSPKAGAGKSDAMRSMANALGIIHSAATSTKRPSDPKALDSATRKLQNMSVILSSADGIEDAMAELQKQRRKETSNRMRSAEGNTTDAFKKMDQLRKHQTELIQKRAEAEKNKGFWGSVCDFFSKVANVFASVAKAIQVVASVTPMGLLSLGISVAKVAFKDEIDKTLGGAAPLVTGLGLQCVSASADIQTGGMTSLSSIDGVSATVELGAGKISEGVAGLYGADALDYQADLVDIKAHRKHAMNQLGDEQEAMHEIAASQAKATKLITNILNTNQRVAQNATH